MSVEEKIVSTLKNAGLESKLGKSYSSFSTHRCGINPFEACVRPEYSPKDGDHIVTVTPTNVERYCLRTPYNYNVWHLVESRPYETPEHMVEIVKGMIEKPKGCWA